MRLGLRVWEPFKNYRPFNNNFNTWFEDAFESLNSSELETGTWLPKVDIYETDERYVINAEIPGLKKEDIDIDLKENTLTIKGEKKFEEKTEKDNYVRVERRYGTFQRSFALSENADAEKINASYSNGVLKVSIPKKEEAKPKQIKVEVN